MRKKQLSNKIYLYVKDHIPTYIFTIVLFIMGVIFGSYIISSISQSQKQEIISYLNVFFHEMNTGGWTNSQLALRQALFDNLKYLMLIWFLGLSIIGMPIIFLLIFMKGFVVGFTISFLIFEMHWRGLILSIVSIIPQNIVIVPVYIIAGVAGISFSLSLIKSRGKNRLITNQQSITSYTLLIIILAVILIFTSAFETFISPYLIKGVTPFLMLN
ncbi:stage II sporulation protein M [Vulcanibacillus modesticaldus]|uniref:Stage II sporulation protein M n=1 Tax=Vulcanibacillus modesticaldus TaxID=337097 RepID=A0A1D2YRY4_9BACI|nr:stage II sporulation protein M [Vulcanibacillus modesticaldus]OEF95554.1 stage II sporulation protein M [Vulcanibacillus modesticaldus]